MTHSGDEEAGTRNSAANAVASWSLDSLLGITGNKHPSTGIKAAWPASSGATLTEVLEKGLSRLRETGTCKSWQWAAGEQKFADAESFRWAIPSLKGHHLQKYWHSFWESLPAAS